MPNGGKNANPIETLNPTKQSAKKSTVVFGFGDVGDYKHDAVC